MYPRMLPPLSAISSLVDSLHPRYGSPRTAVRDLSSYKIGSNAFERLPPVASCHYNDLSPIQDNGLQNVVDSRSIQLQVSHISHDFVPPGEVSVDFQRQLDQLPPDNWLDPNSWIFKIFHGNIKHLSTECLYQGYFHRSKRNDWGINHGTANKKKSATDTPSPASEEWFVPERQGSKQNHSLAEQNRRKRHNELCRHGDNATGTHVFDITNEALPYVKAYIEGISYSQVKKPSSSSTSRGGKQSGKDEQLLSAVFNHYYAALTIMALYDENLQLKREIESLRSHLQHPQTSSVPGMNINLPPAPSRKRKAEDAIDSLSSLREPMLGGQMPEQIDDSSQAMLPKRRDLPPSPTPSLEGCGSSFTPAQQSVHNIHASVRRHGKSL